MIDEKKLVELQNHWKGFPSRLNGNITTEDMVEMLHTIEVLLKENNELKAKIRLDNESYDDSYYSYSCSGDEEGC